MIKLEKNYIKLLCQQQLKAEWLRAKDSFPDFLAPVSWDRKRENELYIKSIGKSIKGKMEEKPKEKAGSGEEITRLANDLISKESILGIHKAMDEQTLLEFQNEIKKLLRRIRKFAPQMEQEEIGQAAKNYVIYAMLKELNGLKQACTPAAFGYSMLYPYTDNYIDDPLHSAADIHKYNQMIRDKIKGLPVAFATEHHQKTCELLGEIEADFPRERETDIYNLLLYMLEAQEDSVRQRNKRIALTQEERLEISLYKGGISVLIDRYLIQKELTEEDLHFYLGFGFFLQLADDLQDIAEDSRNGSQTMMTREAAQGYADKSVNKMFHFIHSLFCNYETSQIKFKDFMLENCFQLLLMSVSGSREYFSDAYLRELEAYFPVSFAFSRELEEKRRNQNTVVKEKYWKKLDAFLRE